MRGGRRKKPPRPGSRGVSEKGRTTPLYFEGLSWAVLGFRQPVYLTGVNFYTFDNGEKSRRTQKSGASDLKNQAEAPLYLVQSPIFAI